MNLKKSMVLLGSIFILLLVGCTSKDDVTEFNKPALYWYQKIGNSITNGNLDKADAYYISLKSEHMRSVLMPTAIMMLAAAHMNNEEYLLANYYLDEHSKRFGEERTLEYTMFMKLKASFLGIKDVYKDQKLIIDSISNANKYLLRYPGSIYAPLVNTILIRLQMSQYLLNENIASLYDRTDKPAAAKLYREKNSGSIVGMSDIKPPEQGLVGSIFD
ncbi:MAG: outer membrane protein assembly factor BamD [Campylobacterota bacterium]|nr:outer membrane protein assembly factor BamD [Campylobacterota bacterium]